jgi:hypothetical protein
MPICVNPSLVIAECAQIQIIIFQMQRRKSGIGIVRVSHVSMASAVFCRAGIVSEHKVADEGAYAHGEHYPAVVGHE